MTEMVERVARALYKAHFERGRGLAHDWNLLDRFEKEMWFFSARAAIEALREPTDAMCEAAEWHQQSEVNQYHYAIDTALGRKPCA